MIGRLSGKLAVKQPPHLLLDVNGVGYEVEAPMSTFFNLPGLGEPVTLHIHFVVREDAQILYGFLREAERKLFRQLLKISGVGGKVALGILSGMNADEFTLCVQAGDTQALTRLPGIGKKTAERLVVEMRDKLGEVDTQTLPGVSGSPAALAPAQSPSNDATAALVALGYKPPEAAKMVRAVQGEGLETEQIIKAALQNVAKR